MILRAALGLCFMGFSCSLLAMPKEKVTSADCPALLKSVSVTDLGAAVIQLSARARNSSQTGAKLSPTDEVGLWHNQIRQIVMEGVEKDDLLGLIEDLDALGYHPWDVLMLVEAHARDELRDSPRKLRSALDVLREERLSRGYRDNFRPEGARLRLSRAPIEPPEINDRFPIRRGNPGARELRDGNDDPDAYGSSGPAIRSLEDAGD